MAPTTTLSSFVRRDNIPIDPCSTFDMEAFRVLILGQPATPHRSVWTPAENSAFHRPILLFLIALCVVGAIMVFILWRWLPFFSDLHSDSSTWKDLLWDLDWRLRGSRYPHTWLSLMTPPHPHPGQLAEQPAPDRAGVRRHVRVRLALAPRPPACWGPLVRGCAAGTGEEGRVLSCLWSSMLRKLGVPSAHGRFANIANIDDSILCTSLHSKSPYKLYPIRGSISESLNEYRSAFTPLTTYTPSPLQMGFAARIHVLEGKRGFSGQFSS
ncbi:hypothetical protein C8R43DRAFT_1133139 [Mycena crocata]|nr:hypothetical protein C8R43DRAFT_1133139 [Mycena crocata]